MRRLIATTCILLLTTAFACRADDFKREGDGERRTAKNALEGKAPPAFHVKGWLNSNGKEIKPKDLKGKVVLIDFWGTWCGPCRAAMPHLKELHEKHKDDGLVIIGIHTTNGCEKMAEFITKEKIPWPVAIDVEKKTTSAFKVDSYPDYYLIDRAGNLRVADLANGDLNRAVQLLLKEPLAR